jgi:hypothetical protein
MIELEIQALSLAREGLLIDVGRAIAACGFALVRQRLADDRHGVLLTLVVRGPARKQRDLQAALATRERIVSFEIHPVAEGLPRPHFAASRTVASNYLPPPAAEAPKPVMPQPVPKAPPPLAQVAPATQPAFVKPQPLLQSELEHAAQSAGRPLLSAAPLAAAAPAPVPAAPFQEVVPLDADQVAVEKLLPKLTGDYPRIFPWLQLLEQSVQAGACESTLSLAGERVGAWLSARQHAPATRLSLDEAMQQIALPALLTLVEANYSGNQLHIRNSPLCTREGNSRCSFFSGYLQGLIGPAIASQALSIFAVCCRSYGADECVLALME